MAAVKCRRAHAFRSFFSISKFEFEFESVSPKTRIVICYLHAHPLAIVHNSFDLVKLVVMRSLNRHALARLPAWLPSRLAALSLLVCLMLHAQLVCCMLTIITFTYKRSIYFLFLIFLYVFFFSFSIFGRDLCGASPAMPKCTLLL